MFDNVCKFLAENYSEDFAQWLLGYKVTLTELKPTELSLQPIRADSLILLQSENLVLHLEFQTDTDETMAFRMIDYRLRVYRRYPQKQMKQVVIYLRKTASELAQQNNFRLEKTYHEFDVIRLWEQPPELFMNQLGLLPLAVLSSGENPKMVLTQIAQTIKQESNTTTKNNLLAISSILAGLVLNELTIKQILKSDIMKESVIYQEILREGEIKGKLEGKIEGKLQGKLEAKLEIALNLLRNEMTIEQVVMFTGLPQDTIEELAQTLTKE